MVPILTEEERRQNLDKALKARRERAEVKTKLPGYALSRAQKLMKRLRIAQSRRIRGLSKRQRNELLEALGGSNEA